MTFAEDSSVDSVVAIIKDLTEQKKLEEVARRKEKLTAMGELASGVAHEIRNPLNTIGIITQRLKREFSVPGGEYDSLLKIVSNEVCRVNQIIEQFLRFARPPRLQLAVVNMMELLNDVTLQIKSQAEVKGIQLEARIESLPEMKVDKTQMKQALLNLLLNAIEATRAGGMIYFNAYAKAQDVRIEIADTGVGIPAENLSKIFDLYFTTKDTGTGIGLPLVNRIITEHGGRIEVSSQEGKGTTFVLSIPAK